MTTADKINQAIDKGEDIGEAILSDYIIGFALEKLALSTTGFLGLLATKLLGYALNKWVFPAITLFKILYPQYYIDTTAEKLSAKKIKESKNESEYIDNITDY